jgi:farnesyl diphosphate synthase
VLIVDVARGNQGQNRAVMMGDIQTALARAACATEEALAALIDRPAIPERLRLAMQHAALGGGKRLRPFLVIETAALLGCAAPAAVQLAAAVECVHCYSLVHDDLPSMDDDDLRRGRPTVHRAFDEATAILAGDALQTFAFEAAATADLDPARRVEAVLSLAQASGAAGMVGGQMLDLDAEGRFTGAGAPRQLDDAAILHLQALKTGALILGSVELGAIAAGADDTTRASLRRYGRAIGEAFQIADDLLDEEADASVVGKATGKDAARGKATLVSLWGQERARAHLAALVEEAQAALAPFGERAETLRQAAYLIANRDR